VKTSAQRILTTHCGSLPRPLDLVPILNAKDAGRDYDHARFERDVAVSVSDVVRRQAALGMDIVNDGEHSKSSFATYGRMRLSGIEETDTPAMHRGPTRDILAFPKVYAEAQAMNDARKRRRHGAPADAHGFHHLQWSYHLCGSE
jgi:5-methyltetrahydropteroyltriglutamate--homocysteine methyltransferase